MSLDDFSSIQFIGESIQPWFDHLPLLEKKPGCPDGFTWRNNRYLIKEMLFEWHDYGRKGKVANNMRPEHLEIARKRGSWGVGRDYYRVETSDSKIYDIYYDRAPMDAFHRKGGWFLWRELKKD